jgi:hypothetical protein
MKRCVTCAAHRSRTYWPQAADPVVQTKGTTTPVNDHPFDLEPGLFANGSAQQIAATLKKSAEDPRRHSSDPYRTAMSMLDFYINRAGAKLSPTELAKLDQTKAALRQSFGR